MSKSNNLASILGDGTGVFVDSDHIPSSIRSANTNAQSSNFSPSNSSEIITCNDGCTQVTISTANLTNGNVVMLYNNTASPITIINSGFTTVRIDGDSTNKNSSTITFGAYTLVSISVIDSSFYMIIGSDITVS